MARLSSAEIKSISALSRKKFRDALGLFVVEGEKMVAEALRSGFEVAAVYRAEDIGEETMSRISMLKNPSPVLAVLRQPEKEGATPLPSEGLCLALDCIRDPGNMGTILRTADWFGVKAVYASPDCVEIYNPKVVQASMGAIFRVPVRVCPLPSLCDSVISAGGMVYGTFLDGCDIYSRNIDFSPETPVLVVVGNESEGISPDVAAKVGDRLTIPRFRDGSESLNAAVATGIVLAEFRRRWVHQ